MTELLTLHPIFGDRMLAANSRKLYIDHDDISLSNTNSLKSILDKRRNGIKKLKYRHLKKWKKGNENNERNTREQTLYTVQTFTIAR